MCVCQDGVGEVWWVGGCGWCVCWEGVGGKVSG